MLLIAISSLLLPACAFRHDATALAAASNSTTTSSGPGDVISKEGFRIKRGPSIPIPGELGEDGDVLPLQWQIEHYVVILRDPKLFKKFATGKQQHHVAEYENWPSTHRLYQKFCWHHRSCWRSNANVPDWRVKEFISRYTLVMKIWILQTLRGLVMGRLGKQVQQFFFDKSSTTRAYLVALLKRMYTAFGHLIYVFEPDETYWAAVGFEWPRICEETHYKKSRGFFKMSLGRAFFKQANHDLREWNILDGSRVGTLMHEVSHLVMDEEITAHSADGWPGDEGGLKCGDDGRLGTRDYAYQNRVFDLNPRDARHNADSVQFFIERSVVSEVDAGHAIEITPEGEIRPRSDLATALHSPSWLFLLVGLCAVNFASA